MISWKVDPKSDGYWSMKYSRSIIGLRMHFFEVNCWRGNASNFWKWRHRNFKETCVAILRNNFKLLQLSFFEHHVAPPTTVSRNSFFKLHSQEFQNPHLPNHGSFCTKHFWHNFKRYDFWGSLRRCFNESKTRIILLKSI